MVFPDQLADRALFENPYPVYQELRERSPVEYELIPAGKLDGHAEAVRAWALMRFADGQAAMRDRESLSTEHQLIGKQMPRALLLNDDPRRHVHLRRLVNKTFTPRRIAGVEAWISSVAQELIADFGREPVEFMSAYAQPLPLRVI